MKDVATFSKQALEIILNNVIDKTLGDVDSKNVFSKTIDKPKITGIAGDVIEQSVLGMKANSRQEADIIVDSIPVEVKTTGLRHDKKTALFVAKEPCSITAVSPEEIVHQSFNDSHFWNKIANILFVYYLYDSEETVVASEYAKFIIKGYEFHKFSDAEVETLKKDWTVVRDFIKYLQDNYDNYEDEYPRLSHELRDKLLYIDTAPKWPNRPRFRFKKDFLTTIVQNHFGKALEALPETYNDMSDVDRKLHLLSETYKGRTVEELCHILNVNVKHTCAKNTLGDRIPQEYIDKSAAEKIIIKMFGGNSKKLNKIDLFQRFSITAKTICISTKGKRTEDMKMTEVDFGEMQNGIDYEDSTIFDYFNEKVFIFMLFKETTDKNVDFKDNIFLGFKRMIFSNDLIVGEFKKTYDYTKNLVINNLVREEKVIKKDGTYKLNPSGTISTELNFPKSKEFTLFIRGGGKDSLHKTFELNGIKMYKQYYWIKGEDIVKIVNDIDFV